MGQFDDVNQAAAQINSLKANGLHSHDLPGYQPDASDSNASGLNFHTLLSGQATGTPATRPVEAPAIATPPAAAANRPLSVLPAPTSVRTDQYVTPVRVDAAPAPVAATGSSDRPPPHPPEGESTDEQMGSLLSGTLVVGANAAAGMSLKKSVRADEISRISQLSEVTKPETLEAVRAQADQATRLVAEKSRAATAEVEKLAMAKPDAFQEISEIMPAKGPGKPPETLVYHQPKPPRALTQEELAMPEEQQALLKKSLTLSEEEMQASDRAEYLRSLEKMLVKDFNMGNTSTVSAFRTRKPYIDGLGATDAAKAEGLAEPLNKLENLSNKLMEETTEGRLALDKAATGSIYKGIGELAAGFIATRGIDHLIYSKPQGMLTTAFDCALPFVVLTKLSPMAKIGIMIGVHEASRAVEYFGNKNKDQ